MKPKKLHPAPRGEQPEQATQWGRSSGVSTSCLALSLRVQPGRGLLNPSYTVNHLLVRGSLSAALWESEKHSGDLTRSLHLNLCFCLFPFLGYFLNFIFIPSNEFSLCLYFFHFQVFFSVFRPFLKNDIYSFLMDIVFF